MLTLQLKKKKKQMSEIFIAVDSDEILSKLSKVIEQIKEVNITIESEETKEKNDI